MTAAEGRHPHTAGGFRSWISPAVPSSLDQRLMTTRRIMVLLSTLLLAGCATGTTSTAASTGAPSTRPIASTAGELPMPRSTPPVGKPTFSSPSAEITVVGVVEVGVEQGCRLLRTAEQLFQLVGSASALIQPGARLRVRGRANPSLLTTCQQGTPFQVIDVQPA
jgi:hypothetical protein